MLPGLAGDLARLGCQNVHIEVVQNAGHYVIADQPATVAALIERYAEVI
jgi:pimeloyl-ACP methyl ester carboxylesterase